MTLRRLLHSYHPQSLPNHLVHWPRGLFRDGRASGTGLLGAGRQTLEDTMGGMRPFFALAYKPWGKTKPHRYYACGKIETEEWMPLAFGFWVLLRIRKP